MDLETLIQKIAEGDIDGVKDFIKNHPDSINKKDGFYGQTALMSAAEKGKTDILKLLLNNDADVNTRHRLFGYTALHWAVACNQREAVEELLKKTTIQVNLEDYRGLTPLHFACSSGYKDIVGLFLSHIGIKPNVVDRQGDTPLHVAVQSQNYDVVTLMLSQESLDLEIRNNQNWTPLLEAVSRSHLGILQKVIARGANVNVVDNEGNNCLHLALTRDNELFYSEVEHMDILDKCCEDLKLGKKERLSQVVVACYLARERADFYCKNKSGRTPLDLIEKGNVKETLMTLFPQCRYCQEKMATVTLQPCGHVVLCENCCSEMTFKKCPMCRQYTLSKTGFETPPSTSQPVETPTHVKNFSKVFNIFRCCTSRPVETPTPGKMISKVSEPTPSTSQPVETPTPGKKFSKVSEPTPSTSQPVETPTPGKKFSKVSQPTPSTSQPVESPALDEKLLQDVAQNLGGKWQQVGRELGIKSVQLEIINHDNPNDTVEQSFQMLRRWFVSCDQETRTLRTLGNALEKVECFDALECLPQTK